MYIHTETLIINITKEKFFYHSRNEYILTGNNVAWKKTEAKKRELPLQILDQNKTEHKINFALKAIKRHSSPESFQVDK